MCASKQYTSPHNVGLLTTMIILVISFWFENTTHLILASFSTQEITNSHDLEKLNFNSPTVQRGLSHSSSPEEWMALRVVTKWII